MAFKARNYSSKMTENWIVGVNNIVHVGHPLRNDYRKNRHLSIIMSTETIRNKARNIVTKRSICFGN